MHQKANALDLFADEKKPKVRKTTRTGKAVLGTISKILDKEEPDGQSCRSRSSRRRRRSRHAGSRRAKPTRTRFPTIRS